ncbi:ARM repeat superfamily protein [Wolffia australiana]
MSSKAGRSRQPHKPKSPSRALFSCGIFRARRSPEKPPPAVSLPPASSQISQLDKEKPQRLPSSSSSSSSSTSQSFTQWRFPLTHPTAEPKLDPGAEYDGLRLDSGDRIAALRLIERRLAQDPSAAAAPCPPPVMAGVVAAVQDPATARTAAKVLLALLLLEKNRAVALEAGAAAAALEAVAVAAGGGAAVAAVAAERALAALELMCTVPEGAAEVRANPTAAGSLILAAEKMSGRGRECAVGVMAAIYAGEGAAAAPPAVGRAVVAALQGECTARGRRKGAQLLKALKDGGHLHLPLDGP